MEHITEVINNYLRQCLLIEYPSLSTNINKYPIHRGNKTDYQFNKVNGLAKLLNLPDGEVANVIHAILMKYELVELVEIVQTDKQIFVVFNVNKNYIQSTINELYSATISIGDLLVPKINNLSKTVLIDFSSPNIAKEMHVGHLRSTIIGESLCRIFEYCGSNVQRINHVGDWGTQFGMLIAYIKRNGVVEYDLPKLMEMYKESRKLFESDAIFNKESRQETVQLQQGSNENTILWKNICDISMKAFNKIYDQLDTHSDVKGESFYQSRMLELVKDLDSIVTKSDGMKVLFAKGFNIPFILEKSDGGFTYDTSDLTALKYRITEEKADQIIYVVDSGQQQHLDILFQLANDLGWVQKNQLNHVGFGLVLGSDGKKLKTRSGETIKLQDLLDQAYEHSKKITIDLSKEKHPEWNEEMIDFVSRKIAINCIKYSDLSNPRLSNYKFSLDKMLNVKGNTGVYLMYALVRCKSILRKIPNIENILSGEILIDTIDAKNLAFKLLKYSETITESIEQLSPHYICNYLYELVGLLTKFYEKNKCIDFDNNGQIIHIHEHRIRLINLVAIVMTKLFYLVGLEHVEQI